MILSNALRILVLILVSCVFQFVHADAGPITLASDAPIESHFQYWEDTGADATLADVRALPPSAWQARPSGKATFGITDSAYWLRVQVRNQTDHDQLLIAELAYSQLDDVVFHESLWSHPASRIPHRGYPAVLPERCGSSQYAVPIPVGPGRPEDTLYSGRHPGHDGGAVADMAPE